MQTKQVIVIRRDLKMRRGKEISQGAHASNAPLVAVIKDVAYGGWLRFLPIPILVSILFVPESLMPHVMVLAFVIMVFSYILPLHRRSNAFWYWLDDKFTKITLQVDSKERLIEVLTAAHNAGLPAYLITDAGKTEFNGVPTETAISIGPADADAIDAITGRHGSHPLELY